MLENPKAAQVRQVARLAGRDQRRDSGTFLVEGPQSTRELLQYLPGDVVNLFLTPTAAERHPELRDLADHAGVPLTYATEQVIAAMADTVTPQGVVAVARQRLTSVKDVFADSPRLVVICEQVRDPGNLGTIIRIADAVAADGVVLTGRTVDPFNPKVARASTGSLFHIPIAVAELAAVSERVTAAGMTLVAADTRGEDILDARQILAGPVAWLFGNEARGLDDAAIGLANRTIGIPLYGAAESLNLATAASVCLYETAFAQRNTI